MERAWIRVAREAVGADDHAVPQQWPVHTTAPGVAATERSYQQQLEKGAEKMFCRAGGKKVRAKNPNEPPPEPAYQQPLSVSEA